MLCYSFFYHIFLFYYFLPGLLQLAQTFHDLRQPFQNASVEFRRVHDRLAAAFNTSYETNAISEANEFTEEPFSGPTNMKPSPSKPSFTIPSPDETTDNQNELRATVILQPHGSPLFPPSHNSRKF